MANNNYELDVLKFYAKELIEKNVSKTEMACVNLNNGLTGLLSLLKEKEKLEEQTIKLDENIKNGWNKIREMNAEIKEVNEEIKKIKNAQKILGKITYDKELMFYDGIECDKLTKV